MRYYYQDSTGHPLGHTASFTYDNVNPLNNAQATGGVNYNLTFGVGRYANMSCKTNVQTQGLCTNSTFDFSTNHINSSGYTYDAAGAWPPTVRTPTNGTRKDGIPRRMAERRTSFTMRWGIGWRHRIGFQADLPVDPSGQRMLGVWNGLQGYWWEQFVPWNGRVLGFYDGGLGTRFLHPNALGTTTMATDYAGNVAEDILLYPWGQPWTAVGDSRTSLDAHFAGFDQIDGATYHTLSRWYPPTQGRWLSPDPDNAGADPSDPQTWNAYAYVRNNPTTLTDPEGTDLQVCLNNENAGRTCNWYSDADYARYASAQNAANQGITVPVANEENGGHPSGNITCGSTLRHSGLGRKIWKGRKVTIRTLHCKTVISCFFDKVLRPLVT
jgi:RHS repeat-associated protein